MENYNNEMSAGGMICGVMLSQTGPRGKDGKTPQKYIDYFTEEEKSEFLEELINCYDSHIEEFKTKLETIEEEKITLGRIDDKLLYDLYEKINSDDINWKNVTIYNGGGDDTYISTSITSDYIYMKKGSTIKFFNIDVYRSRITLYDLNKKYIKNTGKYAARETYTLDEDYYVRIGFDRFDGGTINVSEGNSNNVEFEGYKINRDSFLEKIILDGYKLVTADDVDWKRTTIYKGTEMSDKNAITSDYVFLRKGTKINFNTEYKSRISLYDLNKKYITNTGTYVQRSSYILEDSCYIRIGLNKTGITVAEGNSTNVEFEGYIAKYSEEEQKYNYDMTIKNINHRGYCTIAPENTIVAYKVSKKNGFKYVECDVSFSKDGIAVLLHDESIDRTSNGTGNVKDKTFEELRTFDFGSWKSSAYEGELIPSFEEFISLCKKIGLYPYIELKANTSSIEGLQGLVDTVRRNGMIDNVTWISFSSAYLNIIKEYYEKARLGFVVNSISETTIDTVNSLKNEKNDVFIDCNISELTEETIELCVNNCIPLEVWGCNEESNILTLNNYITGVTSNSLIAGKILYENNIKKVGN